MTNQTPPPSLPEQNEALPPPPTAYQPQMTILEPGEAPEVRRPGCSGCAWGVGGALGCLALLLTPLILLLLAGTLTVNGIVNNVQDMFSRPVVYTAQTVLERVQGMSQLATVRYNYSSLVTSEREMPGILALLYGERQVMVAVGHINAGLDLSQMTAADITIDGNTIFVRLPPPVLQDCFLNEAESFVISRDTGLFAQSAPNLDTEARRFALSQFRDQALEANILAEAQAQAQTVVGDLLRLTSDADTTIQVMGQPPLPETPLPETCQ